MRDEWRKLETQKHLEEMGKEVIAHLNKRGI